jgi:DNA polymerase-3 subunit delta
MFRSWESGKFGPVYLIRGEEPFQWIEVVTSAKAALLKGEGDSTWNYENLEGEHLDASKLSEALDTLPSLFAMESSHHRLVVLKNVDKLPAQSQPVLENYLKNPSSEVCLIMSAVKLDKRKGLSKLIEEKGQVVEVQEPYDRDWPKWRNYFEKKVQKTMTPEVWERVVQASGRSLSPVWSEVQKLACYVGEKKEISLEEVIRFGLAAEEEDIFSFSDLVIEKKQVAAVKGLRELLHSGESEIKILAILVRQFRQIQNYLELNEQGIKDPKVLGPKLGIHPFFISKLAEQAKRYQKNEMKKVFHLLSQMDYTLKTGAGNLFEGFLVPYFSA